MKFTITTHDFSNFRKTKKQKKSQKSQKMTARSQLDFIKNTNFRVSKHAYYLSYIVIFSNLRFRAQTTQNFHDRVRAMPRVTANVIYFMVCLLLFFKKIAISTLNLNSSFFCDFLMMLLCNITDIKCFIMYM